VQGKGKTKKELKREINAQTWTGGKYGYAVLILKVNRKKHNFPKVLEIYIFLDLKCSP
jgi:hypothetical protein